jgi:type I restriction enzyme, S subunit
VSSALPTAKLGDIADLNPPLDAKLSDGDEVSFMPMAAVDADSLTAVDRETRRYSEVRKGYTPFLDGDILVAKITPCFENGKIAQASLSHPCGFGSTEFHVVRPRSDRADARYLVHFLRQDLVRKQGESRMIGSAGQRRVPEHFLAGLTIPLPPLPEQRRIADMLDKTDALRAKRRAALIQLDALHQSIFLDMFGDAATNPKGWEVSRLDDISECLDRLRRPITESDRKPGDVPYYGANGQQGWIDKALFDEPLILVAEDGGYFDEPERGVAYRIDGPAWVNNHAHILRAIPARVDTEFLHRALRHFNFLPFISGTTRAKLTQGQLNAVKLFVPPLDLQREFGARVERLRRVLDLAARAAGQLDALFSALQHQAFRGDLARDASGAAPA